MTESCKLVSIVGARPQFVKLAPISRALLANSQSVAHKIVHTGQHYDESMSASFFDQLEIPLPDIDLGVGSASHGAQTAEMLLKLEDYLKEVKPAAVLVYGDTNSTLAGTLAATKLHIPVAHVEAGLRSFNRKMPEKINRLVADHCSDRLYAPTPHSIRNLKTENLADRAVLTGDVMLDAIQHNIKLATSKSHALEDHNLQSGRFGLVTIHRPINTTAEVLRRLVQALEEIAESQIQLIFPVHPRTKAVLNDIGYTVGPSLHLIDPVPYLDIITLIQNAALVITDSGGLQKEAAILRTPCVTMRDETEWTETVEIGVNWLAGNNRADVVVAVSECLNAGEIFTDYIDQKIRECYGAGDAAQIIARDCLNWLL